MKIGVEAKMNVSLDLKTRDVVVLTDDETHMISGGKQNTLETANCGETLDCCSKTVPV